MVNGVEGTMKDERGKEGALGEGRTREMMEMEKGTIVY